MGAKLARNIFQVVNYIDPDSSIEDAMDACYVNRGDSSPVEDMIRHLLSDSSFPKLIFTGPRGCGKETELIKLSFDRRIQKKFHVRMISAKDKDNPAKLLGAIADKVIEIAKEEKIEADTIEKEIDKIKKHVEGWKTEEEIIGFQTENIPEEIEFGKLKPQEKFIKHSRKKESEPAKGPDYAKHISELTNKIYWRKKCFRYRKKEVLILVTNLDKISLDKVKDLFLDDNLTKIECFIVYTFPFEATRQDFFPQIVRKYSEIYHLFNLNPYEPENRTGNEDQIMLEQILTKRVDPKLFNPPEIKTSLINYSMGIPYEMLKLVKECGILALRQPRDRAFMSNKKLIDQNIFAEVIERKKILFQKTLPTNQKEILKNVYEKKEYAKIDDKNFLELIDLNLITQYGPIENIWANVRYETNPIVLETFPEFKTAKTAEQEEKKE